MVEADLQDIGVDLGDNDLLARRSWDWLRTRIIGLLTRPYAISWAGDLLPVNRIQASLMPPVPEQRNDDGREA